MNAPRVAGDSHNFGRQVVLGERSVEKPRPLLWEWLVLDARSPLRRALTRAAEDGGLGKEAFTFLPSLRFSRSRSVKGGEVERLELEPLPRFSERQRLELAAIAGRALALFSWLGVADLHWENLALGMDGRGAVIFAPLDVEMLFGDFSRPAETKLLPDADPEYGAMNQHAAGLRRLLPHLGKPVDGELVVALAGAYRATLDVLDGHAAELAAVFARLPELTTTPLRVCLRSTSEYVHAGSLPLWPPLLDAEVEQLERGDIPYFFRLYGQKGIFWYRNRALTELGRLPLRGDAPQLDPLLPVARNLRTPSRQKLRTAGLFTVLGAFDHEALRGRFEANAFAATFGARRIVVELPGGAELETQRNLRAFVESIYLPCRCGEVRPAFVPPVTRCSTAL